MKKRGFTLIELLAVIVILAIIALISVPVVTNIISSSKNQTYEISVKNYMSAVENRLLLKETDMNSLAIIDGTYQVMSDGNICIGELSESSCKNILEVDVEGEKPVSGSITISNYKITSITDLTYSNFIANVESEGEITITLSTSVENVICTAVNSSKSGSTTIGTEYKCQVNETTSYNFYVLSKSEDTVNLIMNKNLVDDVYFSTSTEECSYGTSSGNYTICGEVPTYYGVTSNVVPNAISQVISLTSSWTNIPTLNETYSSDIYTVDLTGSHARLATFDEITTNGCTAQYNNYGNDTSGYGGGFYYRGCKSWILGDYWTMEVNGSGNALATWAVNTEFNSYDDFALVTINDCFSAVPRLFGIRPVITVSTSSLG